MVITYIVPVLTTLLGHGPLRSCGLIAWLLMVIAFMPFARFYKVFPLWGIALPVIGGAYTVFTLQSAIEFWQGKGGMWKGRAQARRKPQAAKPAPEQSRGEA